ncbi:MAG: site-2 protease family protein [Planctomycetota bacterium]
MSSVAWLASGRLRARRDLQFTDSGESTIVKDPLSLEYFRIGHRERFLLETLAEPLTVGELTRRYQRRFPNERAGGNQVLAFCASLYECALLLSDQPIATRADDRQGGATLPWYTSLLSPLAIRLPGIDPTPILRCFDSVGGVLFSRGFAAALTLFAIATGVGLLGQIESLSTEIARLTDLLDPAYALMAVIAVLLTKAWHELGHAIACRRMGAECHEIGVMLLAFFPCLYCDVSDAWTLPSRWKRALVALAGVYFEVMLAVAAAAAWLVLTPGPLRVLALYLVVTASLSTLLINLNPLIRFDGYYVLADVWGVANLHAQSRAALWGPLRGWVSGTAQKHEEKEAPTLLLAGYGLLSTVYGWCLLTVILWFTYEAFANAGFAAIGDALVALTVGGLGVVAARSTLGLVPKGPGGRSLGATARLAFLLTCVLGLGGWIATWQLEQTLYARCRVESKHHAEVVARGDGRLEPRVRYGDQVSAGQLLAELDDPPSELRRLELLEREASLVAELDGLKTRAQVDATLLSEIARLKPTLAEVRRQFRAHEAQVDARRLRAPIAGRVSRSNARASVPTEETPAGELPAWIGDPLDGANASCTLLEGESLCRIVGEGVQAVLLLSEDDSGLVREGNRVRIALDRAPGQSLDARVIDISLAVAGGDLTDAERQLEEMLQGPLEQGAAYRLSVSLEPADLKVAQPGALGQARIVTGQETVYGRAARWFRRLFFLG